MDSNMYENNCYVIWLSTCKNLSIPDSVSEKWWAIIQMEYNNPIRHYHNFQHICEFLDKALSLKQKIVDYPSFVLAIFFHDVIYDPKSKSNEDRSIDLFKRFAGDANLTKLSSSLVIECIEATKSHKVNVNVNTDVLYFSDMDMSIIGSNEDRYKNYSEQIRQEYIHVPLFLYCKGRSKFLKEFKNSDKSIFNTKHFKDHYELRAKSNMEWECNRLENMMVVRSKKLFVWFAIPILVGGLAFTLLSRKQNLFNQSHN